MSNPDEEFEETEPMPLMIEASDEAETVSADLLPGLDFGTLKKTPLLFGIHDSAIELEQGLEMREVHSKEVFDLYFKK